MSVEPLGAGNNSRVFRVALDGSRDCRRHVVVKFYRRDAGDARDRLTTEFESLRFLWQNNVRSIPCPIAIAHDRRCAIYEYVDGEVAGSAPPNAIDVDASVEFLRLLKQLRGVPGSQALSAASEACFSIDAIVANVAGRVERLRRAPDGDDGRRMRRWLDNLFAPFEAETIAWARDTSAAAGIAFDRPLAADARTLSPSDFGLHNAIRRPDGRLAFVDFEYFGWDDPAKTIVDFLLHPGMQLPDALKRRFAIEAQALFADIPLLRARTRVVYPLFSLKWAVILLNDFLPERFVHASAERRALQLAKAQALVERVAREYADNPFLS
jgi:Phosphotransferase enzyme family